jgi:hypothetical protein
MTRVGRARTLSASSHTRTELDTPYTANDLGDPRIMSLRTDDEQVVRSCVDLLIPTTVREGSCFLFGQLLAQRLKFQDHLKLDFPTSKTRRLQWHQGPVEAVPGTAKGREELDRMRYIVHVLK